MFLGSLKLSIKDKKVVKVEIDNNYSQKTFLQPELVQQIKDLTGVEFLFNLFTVESLRKELGVESLTHLWVFKLQNEVDQLNGEINSVR